MTSTRISPVDGPNARVGLRCIAYHFDETAPIDEIPMLANDARLLTAFKQGGYERFARSHVSLAEQAVICARKSLAEANFSGAELDAIIIGTSEMPYFDRIPEVLSTHILKGLGLSNIPVFGTTLGSCANYTGSLRMARNMIIAEGFRNVLVIETNQVRGNRPRPYVSPLTGFAGSIFSDGAVSFIVTGDEADFTLVSMVQTFMPIDTKQVQVTEILANNVAAYRHVVPKALSQAGVSLADLSKVFVWNINVLALDALLATLQIPTALAYRENIARTAHVWSADNLIGLFDHCNENAVASGSSFLLLCQGESYYSAIVLRKQ